MKPIDLSTNTPINSAEYSSNCDLIPIKNKPVDAFSENKPNSILISDFANLSIESDETRIEELFVKNPNYKDYLKISKDFHVTFQDLNTNKFLNMAPILIEPVNSLKDYPKIRNYPYLKEQVDHEKWLFEKNKIFCDDEKKLEIRTKRKQKIIDEEGKGASCVLAEINFKVKEGGFFIRDNLTLKGNLTKFNDQLYGKSLYELLPSYMSRKLSHAGIRISELGMNSFLMIAGNLLAPITLGVSKIAANHSMTVVTLSGESIDKKIHGADNEKIVSHAALRGVQLEIPKFIPIVGDVIQIGEACLQLAGTSAILSTKIADLILGTASLAYQEKLPPEELGDPRVLQHLDARIDYLSKFLIPCGEYLLLTEEKPVRRKQLKEILQIQLDFLRTLEKRRTKAFQFYQLALVANRIPDDYVEDIRTCILNSERQKINGHKVARKCLAALIEEKPLKKLSI